jgi:hypothetical protein
VERRIDGDARTPGFFLACRSRGQYLLGHDMLIPADQYALQSSDGENTDAVFDLVDTLASGAQAVVHMLCERIASKSTALVDKSRKPTAAPASDGLVT